MTSRPRILILSAADKEALDVATEVQRQLDYRYEPTVWTQGVFRAGFGALDSFAKAVDSHAYGIFVLTPDDVLQSRDATFLVPRMNVVFELGYFAAKHGIHRAFLLTPRGEKLNYLSDLAGIQPVDFNLDRFRKGEQEASLGAAIRSIESAIRADRLDYPEIVQNRPNVLAMNDNAALEADKRYCLAVKLSSGHAIRIKLIGTPHSPGAELSMGWMMSSTPPSIAWDHSTGIVGGTQTFWASGPAEAFTDFRVSNACKQLTIEIYENANALDKEHGIPQRTQKLIVQQSV
ncbi:TIR domain-containing protein [Lysobacter brunescens]|uniref:TIR domain-containing protein n=1 Tax=Lysobacter brunescens TaxID=262323 RepID=A0ABW2YFR0_9GAMM